MICENCEKALPWGCCGVFSHQEHCPLSERTEIHWRIGKAVIANLSDRSGIKHEIGACDYAVQAEMIETIGTIAIQEMAREVTRGRHTE